MKCALEPGRCGVGGEKRRISKHPPKFGRNRVETRWGIEYFGLDITSGDEEALDMAEKTTHHVMPMLLVRNTDNYISGAYSGVSSRCSARSGVRNERIILYVRRHKRKDMGRLANKRTQNARTVQTDLFPYTAYQHDNKTPTSSTASNPRVQAN